MIRDDLAKCSAHSVLIRATATVLQSRRHKYCESEGGWQQRAREKVIAVLLLGLWPTLPLAHLSTI